MNEPPVVITAGRSLTKTQTRGVDYMLTPDLMGCFREYTFTELEVRTIADTMLGRRSFAKYAAAVDNAWRPGLSRRRRKYWLGQARKWTPPGLNLQYTVTTKGGSR